MHFKFLWIKKIERSTNHHPWQVVACELLSNSVDKLFHSNLKFSITVNLCLKIFHHFIKR